MTVFAGVLGYESFWLGAEGWVAVCSNVIPRWSAELFELVADKRDMDDGLALYRKMTPLLWWVGGPRYVSGTKACFEMMGCRWARRARRACRCPRPSAPPYARRCARWACWRRTRRDHGLSLGRNLPVILSEAKDLGVAGGDEVLRFAQDDSESVD